MNILDLAEQLNLFPRRAASTKGGEYKSKCPKCQTGTDRFCIWPNQGESGGYWCRVCDCRGDGIQFCRDFLGMTFQEACQKMHIALRKKERFIKRGVLKTAKFIPQVPQSVNRAWQQKAGEFTEYSQQKLMKRLDVVTLLTQRGLSLDTIQKFHLGWNQEDLFEERKIWGIPSLIKENGSPKCQWVPKGIVIPSYINHELIKIKIRRTDWHLEDHLPKYVEVSGGKQSLSIYGDDQLSNIIVVESELDAILLQEHIGDVAVSLALGGCSKKPDAFVHEMLKRARLILISLDMDESGKRAYGWWQRTYSNSRIWPVPACKSPGDAYQAGINLKEWVLQGIQKAI
jgi:DNA primase